jgi:hypothetical protein
VEALAGLIPAELLPRERIKQTIAEIDRLALERQSASGADHPVVQRFWEIVDHIIGREDGMTVHLLNHYRDPNRKFAINLVEFEQRARAIQLIPPSDTDLKKHLRGSRSRKFLAAKSVNSRNGKSVHCWVFENPAGASPQT